MKKLPAASSFFVMPLMLTFMMTCVVSAISVLRARGLDEGFVEVWLPAWGISWVVAFPVMLFVLPLAKRLMGLIVEPPVPGTSRGS